VDAHDGAPTDEVVTDTPGAVMAELRASARGFARSFRTPSLAKALVALIAFSMTEWAAYIALIVYAFAEGGTATVGLVSTLTLLVAAVVAPLGSVLGDRYRRERVLILAHGGLAIGTGVTGIAMLAALPPPVVYVAAIVSAALLTLVRPTHNAVLPALAPTPSDLTAAYAASGMIESACAFLGPLLATIVFAVSGSVSGPGSINAALAVLLVLGTGLVATIPAVEPQGTAGGAAAPRPTLRREVSEGVRTAWHDPRARLLVGLLGMWTFVLGVIDVLIVVLAFEVLGTGDAGVGLMNVSIGVGSIIGAMVAVVMTGRRRLAGSFRSGLLVTGAPVAATAIVPVAAGPLFAFSSAGMALSNVAGITMLQRLIPDAKLTRVLGVLESMYMGGEGLGALAASVAVVSFGPRWTLVVGGLLLPVIMLVVGGRLADLDVGVRVPEQELAVLRRTRIFSVLPGPALERLARNAVPVHAEAGMTVIREGDAGDRYYAVASGSVDVSRAGEHVSTLGPGQEFGEIALLRDVPRTATVVATTDSRLLSLHRDEFLAALTGEAQTAAHETARDRLEGPTLEE
jgi:MFS family permease